MKTANSRKATEGSVASLARIRENQRRSRARRKEHVQHLEQRLRSFEILGVSASREIQEAGKKVSAENALLRSLLMLHGVTEEEIKGFLRSQKSSIPSVASSTAANSRLMTTSNDSPVDSYRLPPNRTCGQLHSPLHELDSIETRYSPPKSTAKRCTGLKDAMSSTERVAALDSIAPEKVYQPQRCDGGQHAGQSTSCENAAGIIASMRHYSDIRDVRSELGCASETNCMVKNMSIFDVLDK